MTTTQAAAAQLRIRATLDATIDSVMAYHYPGLHKALKAAKSAGDKNLIKQARDTLYNRVRYARTNNEESEIARFFAPLATLYDVVNGEPAPF